MGIGDRDYMGSRGGLRGPSSWNPIWVIIAINVIVFIVWQMSGPPTRANPRPGNPELFRFMYDNFTVSKFNLTHGRVWVLFTAAFSHNSFGHILINMLIFFGFGQALLHRWGARRFVLFYLGAALISSAFHPLFSLLGWPSNAALGASGAIAGVIMCFALYYPKAKILLYMIIPMPAWFLVAIGVGLDVYGLINQRNGGGGNIGHAVHLGGAFAGAVYVLFIEKRLNLRGGPRRMKRPRGRVLRPDESGWTTSKLEPPHRSTDPEDMLLDELLEKVSRGGLDSLSIQERETLERISQQRRSGR